MLEKLWSTAKVSPRGKINYADVEGWIKNALVFLAPTLLVLIADIIKALPAWIADNPALVVVLIYVLNRVTDLISRFMKGK